MAYFLFRSSDVNTPFAIINEETVDNTSSSLSLVGRRRVNYGESQQQNQLWLLENFAAATAPANPITGQLWYDTGVNYLRVYNGSDFVRVSNAFTGAAAPQAPSMGQFWFNTDAQQLNIYNGAVWVAIGPDNRSLIYSIIFGS